MSSRTSKAVHILTVSEAMPPRGVVHLHQDPPMKFFYSLNFKFNNEEMHTLICEGTENVALNKFNGFFKNLFVE